MHCKIVRIAKYQRSKTILPNLERFVNKRLAWFVGAFVAKANNTKVKDNQKVEMQNTANKADVRN